MIRRRTLRLVLDCNYLIQYLEDLRYVMLGWSEFDSVFIQSECMSKSFNEHVSFRVR